MPLVNPVKNLDEAIEKGQLRCPTASPPMPSPTRPRNAEKLAAGLEVGNLSINHFVASIAETPFGGVKESGYGREGGIEGLNCYTVVKNVSHSTAVV